VIRLVLAALSAVLVSGCMVMVPGHLYPVQGPLSAESPAPIYKFTLSGVFKSGTLSATLPDGEVCKGAWSAIAQGDPSAQRFSAQWDAVYGSGFFVANVLGNPVFAGAILTGNKGTTLNVQFYDPVPGQVNAVKGIAVDNQGNLFKLTL
jgi:hypothetical protein